MGITRTTMAFERDFTQIPNAWLRDERLSRRARGLLAELMTHRAGWHVTIAGLQKAGPEGRDAIRGAVLELAECGYLVRRQTQGAHGRFNEIEYEINDPAAVGISTAVGKSDTGGFTDDGSADDGFSDVGESATKNTSTSEHHLPEDHHEELTPPPSAREIESQFDRAYSQWPKKVERKRSLDAFIRAAKSRDLATLTADVIRFGQAYAATTERQFVPALCVWLKGERWTDDPPVAPIPTEAEWNALMAPTERALTTAAAGRVVAGRFAARKPTRGEENLAVVARIEAQERAKGGCEAAGHRWLPDGTCVYCPEHRYPTALQTLEVAS
ncbi:hypothetical protein FBY40_1593 [Microbacterium sp. SLBN-154]|uniref:hypothetical protein n=1 Tax=Microbacterium sp. SLBN-154 TaxID=2768458 RepID=UPI001150B90C|nr:hypothetical protein [Microbacterium sp. SLBN-154]TQK19102.1 hypothetical protein FBY40_1593 [Microbacterium sp. SLBN-154]